MNGYVQVYTGDGKGKTTAALGLALRAAETELVLTGRYAHPEVIARADLVTEMKAVKRYYQKGVAARNGIER
ncbi:MAG: cob(I)yrinic acid a,c-diamide adenosyltransferase [Desulfobacterales bacterium]